MLEQERPRLIPLPQHPFETDIVRSVSSGKTPYVRFDRNLYSIPFELVRRPLTLVASAAAVRVLDGAKEVARHVRSYDTGVVVEDPNHVEALARLKARASGLRARDRLQTLVPSTQLLFERLAERGESLGHHTNRLVKLLDDCGADELAKAVTEALAHDAVSAGAVAHILEKQRRSRGLRPPVTMVLPDHPGVRALNVVPHKLEEYDALVRRREDDDPDADR